ncbi:sigma factor [Micromonospora zamorensis]|uniref:sigma factor n=1 Tax=Micromonospora zamorensis TaxID=709883 RepID=UPI003CEB7623
MFVNARGAALKWYAYLLCGNDSDAEDLVQDALVRAFTRPRRDKVENPEQSFASRPQPLPRPGPSAMMICPKQCGCRVTTMGISLCSTGSSGKCGPGDRLTGRRAVKRLNGAYRSRRIQLNQPEPGRGRDGSSPSEVERGIYRMYGSTGGL